MHTTGSGSFDASVKSVTVASCHKQMVQYSSFDIHVRILKQKKNSNRHQQEHST